LNGEEALKYFRVPGFRAGTKADIPRRIGSNNFFLGSSAMTRTIPLVLLFAAAVVSLPASAQDKSPPKQAPAALNATTPANARADWRASKLIGLNVYNDQNQKVGDINEVLLDHSGKVAGVVLGVGGFLGMGEHNEFIAFDQVKFVDEPLRAASTAPSRPSTTGSPAGAARPATSNTAPTRTKTHEWYPDHAVINATKDQLKAMPQFKYS
jgi:sporulation protein YlmC with PRC-barrel domain